MSDGLLLGLDVGGTRTRALVASAEGEALAWGESGAGNHEIVGYEGLRSAMSDAVNAAIAVAAAQGNAAGVFLPVLAAGFGVAGFDWESERADTMAAIDRLGLGCPVTLVNDSALGLAAGSTEGWGVNVTAGTSNNCYARSPQGLEGRLAGGGALVGELGGASEIAAAALAAINHARLLRGPTTAMSKAFYRLAGKEDATSFIEAVTSGRVKVDASWAPLVFSAARGGDKVALDILHGAGRELGESAAAVARQACLSGRPFEVVLSGSLFSLGPWLEEGLADFLRKAEPDAGLVRLEAPPVVGAVILAAEALAAQTPGARPALERKDFRSRLLESAMRLSGAAAVNV